MAQLAFISHNSRDKEVAREVALFLTTEGVNVWFDEWNIAAGDSIVREVNFALERCTHFILIWSANAAGSPWVGQEAEATVKRGIESGVPRIIPVVLDTTPLPPLVSAIRYIRFGGGTEQDRRNIVRAVVERDPSSNYTRAVVKKYKELVRGADESDLIACPECGSPRVKIQQIDDYERDRSGAVATCEECGWGDLLAYG